jgi:hypothetical protein
VSCLGRATRPGTGKKEKTVVLVRLCGTLLLLFAIGVANAQSRGMQSLASLDAQARADSSIFAARAQLANERLVRGMPIASVQALLGQPETIQRSTAGRDQVEVWGYHGFDVRIQFKNGFVDTWFVRFAQ